MKIIFIYGSPATGKLSVAKELSKITKFKIFHNHLTVDLICSIFDFGSKPFINLNTKIKKLILKTAVDEKINGLILTMCYSNPESNKYIFELIKDFKKIGININFVQLYCNKLELKKRVKNINRQKYNKIKSIKHLNHTLNKYDFFTPIPNSNSLIINNSNISAKKVANIIKKNYKL